MVEVDVQQNGYGEVLGTILEVGDAGGREDGIRVGSRQVCGEAENRLGRRSRARTTV